MTKTIRHSVILAASPHEAFEALLDSKKHSAFTGDTATVSRKVGGRFSTFGGYASGVNVRIEKDRVIEQTWRTTDYRTDEPDSTVTFTFARKGKGTELRFVQAEVPDRLAVDLRQGWKDFYWTPLKAFLAKATE